MTNLSEQELYDLIDATDTWIDEFDYKQNEKLDRMRELRNKLWETLKKRLADRGYELK